MSTTNITFSSQVASCLDKLFENDDTNIKSFNPKINFYGKDITFQTLHKKVFECCLNNQLSTTAVSIPPQDFANIDMKQYDAFTKALLSIDRDPNNNCTIQVFQIKRYDNVEYRPHYVNKYGVFVSPSLRVHFPASKPNTKMTINTGCSFRIPKRVAVWLFNPKDSTKISLKNNDESSNNYILVPQFVIETQDADILPSITAKDPVDTGFICISIINRTGNPCTLSVYFIGLEVCTNLLEVRIDDAPIDAEQKKLRVPFNDSQVFKNRDFSDGRWIKNLKIKFDANSGEIINNGLGVQFNVLDTKQDEPRLTDKVVKFNNQITLFTSRKREHCNSDIYTFPGIFIPKNDDKDKPNTLTNSKKNKKHKNLSILPKVFCDKKYLANNTHCVSFIKSRVYVFDYAVEPLPSFYNLKRQKALGRAKDGLTPIEKLITFCPLNGSFFSLFKYREASKRFKELLKILNTLNTSAAHIQIKIPALVQHHGLFKLLRILDYKTDVKDLPQFSQLIDNDDKTLCELFNKVPLSVCIRKQFYNLMMIFIEKFDDVYSQDEIEKIKLDRAASEVEKLKKKNTEAETESDAISKSVPDTQPNTVIEEMPELEITETDDNIQESEKNDNLNHSNESKTEESNDVVVADDNADDEKTKPLVVNVSTNDSNEKVDEQKSDNNLHEIDDTTKTNIPETVSIDASELIDLDTKDSDLSTKVSAVDTEEKTKEDELDYEPEEKKFKHETKKDEEK